MQENLSQPKQDLETLEENTESFQKKKFNVSDFMMTVLKRGDDFSVSDLAIQAAIDPKGLLSSEYRDEPLMTSKQFYKLNQQKIISFDEDLENQENLLVQVISKLKDEFKKFKLLKNSYEQPLYYNNLSVELTNFEKIIQENSRPQNQFASELDYQQYLKTVQTVVVPAYLYAQSEKQLYQKTVMSTDYSTEQLQQFRQKLLSDTVQQTMNQTRKGLIMNSVYNLPTPFKNHNNPAADPNKPMKSKWRPQNFLKFDGNYEGGNLHSVWKIDSDIDQTYEIILNPDYQTGSNVSYFNFAVQGVESNNRYLLKLSNLSAHRYKDGFRPLVFTKERGWERPFVCAIINSNFVAKGPDFYMITGFENVLSEEDKQKKASGPPGPATLPKKEEPKKKKKTPKKKKVDEPPASVCYQLCFEVFYENDPPQTLFIMSDYQYSYADLLKYCHKLNAEKWKGCVVQKFCNSEFVNQVPIIVIHRSDIAKDVVIIARIHAQDSATNFFLEGVIDFVLGRNNEKMLKEIENCLDLEAKQKQQKYFAMVQMFQNSISANFNIHIIPMLNVDGVVIGNSQRNPFQEDYRTLFFDFKQGHKAISVEESIKYISTLTQTTKLAYLIEINQSLTQSGNRYKFLSTRHNYQLQDFITRQLARSGFQTQSKVFNEELYVQKTIADNVIAAPELYNQCITDLKDKLSEFVKEKQFFSEFPLAIQLSYRLEQENMSVKFSEQFGFDFYRQRDGIASYALEKQITEKAIIFQLGTYQKHSHSDDLLNCQYLTPDDFRDYGRCFVMALGETFYGEGELYDEMLEEIQTEYINWVTQSIDIACKKVHLLQTVTYQQLQTSEIEELPQKFHNIMVSARYQVYQIPDCLNPEYRILKKSKRPKKKEPIDTTIDEDAQKKFRNLFKATELYQIFDISKEAEELSDSENELDLPVAEIDPKQCLEVFREMFQEVHLESQIRAGGMKDFKKAQKGKKGKEK